MYGRTDCCVNLLDNFKVSIYNAGQETWSYSYPINNPPYENILSVPAVTGDEVKVYHPATTLRMIQLAEVMVMGVRAQNQSTQLFACGLTTFHRL